MDKSISTATCIGKVAIEARRAEYKSANAAAKAMGLDPKTVRQIESGISVRLTTIRVYASHLRIPIGTILTEEDCKLVADSQALLDYRSDHLFHDCPLFVEGQCHLPIVQFNRIGHPCDATMFLSLLRRMKRSGSPVDWMPDQEPIWKMHESTKVTESLVNDLESLNKVMANLRTKNSDLASMISELKAQESIFNHLRYLESSKGLHILGCMVNTCVTHKNKFGYQYLGVQLPLFLIAPVQIQEFGVMYKKLLSPEEVSEQFSLENIMRFEELQDSIYEEWENPDYQILDDEM